MFILFREDILAKEVSADKGGWFTEPEIAFYWHGTGSTASKTIERRTDMCAFVFFNQTR